MQKQWASKQTGFTLVELLIVIVVIAILAAISIVAYRGIQDRARDSAMMSDLTQVAKKLEVYNAEHGEYPDSYTKAATMQAKFSFSPATTNVLLCSDTTGYAVFARYPGTTKQYIITKGSAPRVLTPTVSWGTGAVMCATTPYTASGWGTYWLSGE